MENTFIIRNVKLNDAASLTAIYNYYIKTSIITFEEIEIDETEMRRRIENIAFKNDFPFYIYELNDKIVAYAYANTWRERNAYRYSVESSIYLHPDYFGNGIGFTLYDKLISELKNRKFHVVVGGISLPNEASVKLHEKLGFKEVAHYKEVGYKFDRWIDVGFWQLLFE